MSSNTKAELVKKLLQDITLDQERYQQLKELLQQQYTAMLSGQIERLLEINQQLEAHYNTLESTALCRKETLLTLGIPSSATGIELLFGKLPPSVQQRVRGTWQELENLARICHSLNERNGLLLTTQMEVLKPLIQEGELDFLYSD